MSKGEQLYLLLVLASFVIFSITLATSAWRTERFLRANAPGGGEKGTQLSLSRAA